MRAGLFGLRGTFALVHEDMCPCALALAWRAPYLGDVPVGHAVGLVDAVSREA